MEIILGISVVINVVLLYLWNKEVEDHIRTLTISTAVMKGLNKTIEELRQKLKGGVADETKN